MVIFQWSILSRYFLCAVLLKAYHQAASSKYPQHMFIWGDKKSYSTGHPFHMVVEVLRPSQPSGVISSEVSLPDHTFTGQAQSSKQLTNIVQILSPETDNCPSWTVAGREWRKKYFIDNLHERMLPIRRGWNPQPSDHQSDTHPTEPMRPADTTLI